MAIEVAGIILDPPVKTEFHVRKTVAFDGAAGNGAIGQVAVFTVSGRVRIARFSVFCTEDLVGGATISFGSANRIAALLPATTATVIDLNEWWHVATPLTEIMQSPDNINRFVSADLTFDILTAAITDGTLVIDVWYEEVTDGATLRAA